MIKFILILLTIIYYSYSQTPFDNMLPKGKEIRTLKNENKPKYILTCENNNTIISYMILDDYKLFIFDINDSLLKVFEFNYLDKKFWSIDPKASEFPHQSPYLSMDGNPILKIDPNGESTITSNDGTVIEVNNDNDLGIYKSDLKPGEHGPIQKMGETEFWDEFISPDGENKGQVVGKIIYGESWDNVIDNLSLKADKMNLIDLAKNSGDNELFDIKWKKEYSPHGQYTGKKINGKYYTARSAGNYLAGYNAAGSRIFGITISFETFQKLAGAFHKKERNLDFWEKAEIVILGTEYAPAPTYGESFYQYRMSKKGWDERKSIIRLENANEIENRFKYNIGPKW